MMNGYGRGLDYGYDMMGGGLGLIAMLLFVLLTLAGIVLLVVWALRSMTGSTHSTTGPTPPSTTGPTPPVSTGHDEAIAIAKKRLASGEITAEQYEEIMRTLGG